VKEKKPEHDAGHHIPCCTESRMCVTSSVVFKGHNGPGYKEQNVYNCGFLEVLRHYETSVVRKLFKIKNNAT
jgi:hypothetical protein